MRIEETFGALVYWDELRNQEFLLTSFEQFEVGHWLAPLRPCPLQDGQGQLKPGNHDGPAGPIVGVLEIQYRAAPLAARVSDRRGSSTRTTWECCAGLCLRSPARAPSI